MAVVNRLGEGKLGQTMVYQVKSFSEQNGEVVLDLGEIRYVGRMKREK